MRIKRLLLLGLIILSVLSCKKKQVYFKSPVSDLGHIDIVLDSASFSSIINNSFLTKEFAPFIQDTLLYENKKSYDIYLLGQESFLHLCLAKDYWEGKSGTGVFVFQTRKPDMKDSLLLAWKQYYTDSLIDKDPKDNSFGVGEVLSYYPERKMPKPIHCSILMSYTQESYRNWGISESSIKDGISMQEFMYNWDSTVSQKLFKRITQIDVQVTNREFEEMSSALKTVGYTLADNTFSNEPNPKIFYKRITDENRPRITRLEIELSESVSEKEFAIGDSYHVRIKGNRMIMLAN